MKRRSQLAVLIAALLPASVLASTIEGVVLNNKGKVVSNATVEVTKDDEVVVTIMIYVASAAGYTKAPREHDVRNCVNAWSTKVDKMFGVVKRNARSSYEIVVSISVEVPQTFEQFSKMVRPV